MGATFGFRLGPLKSGMFGKVESNVKMTERWRWQGGNGEEETGEQGEAANLEDARGQGEAVWVEEAGMESKASRVEEAETVILLFRVYKTLSIPNHRC